MTSLQTARAYIIDNRDGSKIPVLVRTGKTRVYLKRAKSRRIDENSVFLESETSYLNNTISVLDLLIKGASIYC